MSSLQTFSDHVSVQAEEISLEVVNFVIDSQNLQISEEEKAHAVSMYINLLSFFGQSLKLQGKDEVPSSLIEWSRKNAEMQVTAGGKISEIVIRYNPTRVVFNDIMTRLSIRFGLSIEEHASILKTIDSMLDTSLYETVLAYEKLSETYREKTHKELVELSSPLVPVLDGVIVLPLIGYIDEERALHIRERAVPKIASLNATHVILDFSGVATIDPFVATTLQRLDNALRMMGIEVFASGLRPQLAQTIVNTGIDLSSLQSFSTVKQALDHLQKIGAGTY